MALQRVKGAYTRRCGTWYVPTLHGWNMTETSWSEELPEYCGLTSLWSSKTVQTVTSSEVWRCSQADSPLLSGEILLIELVSFSMLASHG